MSGVLRVDRVVTSGTFELDGGSWDVDNNIWLVGDDDEVLVIDAAHTAQPIIDAVGGRKVVGIVCTHGHNDHVTVAPELSEKLDAPIYLNPAERRAVADDPSGCPPPRARGRSRIAVAGTDIQAIHTPGHSTPGRPACTCRRRVSCSPATPCSRGTRATGRSFSDFPTIIGSIRDKLSHYRGKPASTPVTATTPPWAPNHRTLVDRPRSLTAPPPTAEGLLHALGAAYEGTLHSLQVRQHSRLHGERPRLQHVTSSRRGRVASRRGRRRVHARAPPPHPPSSPATSVTSRPCALTAPHQRPRPRFGGAADRGRGPTWTPAFDRGSCSGSATRPGSRSHLRRLHGT
ncbi:MBL fold metallo-hydrolase [Rhodococcus hoagii]|nr:MBL fold metallo-hydrolase [Prescottella equi]